MGFMSENFDDRLSRMYISVEWEKMFEARNWIKKIPFIPFKQGWLIKPIPPFAGAVSRFLVSIDGEKYVSVYLDCYSILGAWNTPYWEVYPHDGDTFRCNIDEVDRLVEAIEISLNEINNED